MAGRENFLGQVMVKKEEDSSGGNFFFLFYLQKRVSVVLFVI